MKYEDKSVKEIANLILAIEKMRVKFITYPIQMSFMIIIIKISIK